MSEKEAINLSITVLGTGKTGPIDRDIDGFTPKKEIRGPFDVVSVKTGAVPTYPVLWEHYAERERTMCFEGDCEGIPRQGADPEQEKALAKKVDNVWATASHCHFNLNYRFNTQSTSMQFTPRKTIGGRAWQTIKLVSVEQEKALVLWGNTSLGLLLRWWHSNKEQAGRGNVVKTAMEGLPILNLAALSSTQLENAVKIFAATCLKPLLPFHEIDKDPVRKELDERFAREVLGLPESLLQPGGAFDVLRMKLAQEPSIRGNK